jgi:hypothetical protein
MFERTTTRTVVIAEPFRIDGDDQVFPAGTYEVSTDEELISELSFTAYRRVRTTMTLADTGTGMTRQVLRIEPAHLDEILAKARAANPGVCSQPRRLRRSVRHS